MKTHRTVILAAILSGGTLAAPGQGALNWGNDMAGFRAPIYGFDPANPCLPVSGQTAISRPAGTTVYNGPLLEGTGWTFAVFAGPTPDSLSLLASTTFRTSFSPWVLPAGLVTGGTATVPGMAPGSSGFFQIRVWDNTRAADWTTAEQLWISGLMWGVGESPVLPVGPLGGIDPVTGHPLANPETSGWTSFNLYYIPEPSTIALAGLGLAAMSICRRRGLG